MAEDDTTNDEQAQKLIESLSAKMVEAILPKITETVTASVEDQIKGIKEKNDELLGKLADTKNRTAHDRLMDAADTAMKSREKVDPTAPFKRANQPNVTITKSDARDVATYRAAKAEAEKRGVSLEIVEDA